MQRAVWPRCTKEEKVCIGEWWLCFTGPEIGTNATVVSVEVLKPLLHCLVDQGRLCVETRNFLTVLAR